MSYPPIGPEDLARLHELGAAEQNLREQLYDLELAKIPIWAAGKRIREEQDAVYRRIAVDRGLAAGTVLDINMKSGEVRVAGEFKPSVAPEEPPPPPE